MKRAAYFAVIVTLGLGAALLYWSGRSPKPLPPFTSATPALPEIANATVVTTNSISSTPPSGFSTALDAALHEETLVKRSIAFSTAFARWFDADPNASLAYLKKMAQNNEYTPVMFAALPSITMNNPQAATAFVNQMPPGELQKGSASIVARTLASQDVDTAITWFRSLPAGDAKQVALINTLDIWAKKSATDAAQFVANMPAGAEQDYAVAHLAENLAEKNPSLAIHWIDQLPTDSARVNATVSAASGWARQNPADASRWAASLPTDSPGRADALNGSLSYWVMADADAAGKYVQALPETDQATSIKAVAPTLAQNDPHTALHWAQAFTSTASRQIALQEVLARWKENQPDEAARWVQANQ